MPETRTQSQPKRDRIDASTDSAIKQCQRAPDNMSHLSEYPHIDLQSNQIRTLYILPGTHDDPLCCTLGTEFLDTDHEYEALSYVWGDPHDCRSIEVDGKQNNVTVNLFNALRRLRYPEKQRCLWVDALCIDQENHVEKSHQVQLMSKIYSRTTKAILWLGDFSDGMNTTSNYIPHQEVRAAFGLIKFAATSRHVCDDSAEHKDLIYEGCAGLSALLQLPWWHRAWTVQETVLPADAIVVCGTLQFPFSWFIKTYRNAMGDSFRNCCKRWSLPDTFWEQMHPLVYARRALEKNTMPFADALNLFRHRHASDPRDKMYAYLSFGTDVSADYSLEYEQAFIIATRSLIQEYGTLEFLLRAAEVGRSPNLPSWVPDWSADINNQNYLHELGWYHFYWHYSASGERKAQIGPSSSNNILSLQGSILEKITEVGDVMDSGSVMRETVVKWQGGPNGGYPQGGTYVKASWLTLLGNMTRIENYFDRLQESDNGEAIVNSKLKHNHTGRMLQAFGRKGFFTDTGMIGMGHPELQVGDSIVILQGGNMPFILRQVKVEEVNTFYQFIGQAYVHGIMYGEILEKGLEFEWISLI